MCDTLDAIATTVQHVRTAFRSDAQIEPPEGLPINSKSITSVDTTRKVERKFAVRSVTGLIVDDGQRADRGRKTRLNDVDGSVRCMTSAGRIERLLRNKRSFGELWNQKGECVIPSDERLCSLATLSESSQTRQMDKGEIEVEEERRVRMKRMPVLPTDRETHETIVRTWRIAASARQILASIWRTSRRCHEWPWTVDSLLIAQTWTWSRTQC